MAAASGASPKGTERSGALIAMPDQDPRRIERWIAGEFARNLGLSIQAMAGEEAVVEAADSPSGRTSSRDDDHSWIQPFDVALDAPVEVASPVSAWTQIGQRVLSAAGVEDAADEDRRSTYLEILQQAMAGVASSLTSTVGREILCAKGEAGPSRQGGARYSVKVVLAGGEPIELLLLVPAGLIGALAALIEGATAAAPGTPVESTATPAGMAPAAQTQGPFEVLFDVELPVSVSFGRAYVALKDVLKLTSGSIVELNRAINEPVEIIVNNCVVARGEVVVIEGNYGVRIQQIVSQRERVRTLR